MPKEQLREYTLAMMDVTRQIKLKDVGFDSATGGGVPLNSIIEIYGSEASGKTTLCFEIAYRFLQEFPNKFVYYYNYERSIDKFYVRTLLKEDATLAERFKIVEPEFLEDGMEHLLETIDSRTSSLCIIDSLAAMQPKAEEEKALDKAQVGGFKAKLMAEVCRKIGQRLLKDASGKSPDTSIIFINHMNPVLGSFLPQNITPGGKAVKFWASLRIEIGVRSRLQKEETVIGIGKDKVTYGNICQGKIEKNKYAPPYRKFITYIILGKGIDRAMSLIDYALAIGIVGMKGKTDYYLVGKEDKTVRGKQKFADTINSNPNIFNYLYSKVVEYVEARQEQAKNPNIETISKDPNIALQGSPASSESEESTEITQMFNDLEIDDSQQPEDFGEL